MKKSIYLLGLAIVSLWSSPASAQENIFNHLSVGAEVGTTGWGFEVASPLTHYVTLRTGFTTLPRFHVNTNMDYKVREFGFEVEKNVDITAKAQMTDYKLLADIYPFKNSSFHLTGGFYAGLKDLITIHNTSNFDVPTGEGLKVAGVMVRPNDEGMVNLRAQTQSFKPYIGLGFGRPISSKHKVITTFDLGVMFWGKPHLDIYSLDEDTWVKLDKKTTDNKDFQDFIKNMEKVSVYPVLNLRIYYNVF